MLLMKKSLFSQIFVILLATFFVNVYANTTLVKTRSQDISPFKFTSVDDGVIFILGPESENSLLIKVNKILSNGAKPDIVTVSCNAKNYRLEPDTSVMCYGNANDMSWMSIAAKDFKNGAEGYYEFIPLHKK